MRSNTIFVSLFFFILLAAVLVLLAGGYFPPGTVIKTKEPPAVQDLQVEPVEGQVEADVLISNSTETATTQMTPELDGQSLLQSRCGRCHVVEKLEQIEKTRSEWEEAVALMKGMGVKLSDAEKVVLLDYLTATDEP
jgi:hypothetical protein